MADIKAALAKLDVSNDNHWTQDGAPRLDTVKMFAGDQSLTRDAVTAAAPGFSRASALQALQAAAAPAAGASTPEGTSAPPASAQQPPTAEKQPPVAPVQTPPDLQQEQDEGEGQGDPAELLREEIAHARANLEQGYQYRAKVDAELKKAQDHLAGLEAQLEKLQPKETNAQAIQKYLATQRQLLAQRSEKAIAWKQAGIDLKNIIPQPAPIDAAMRRKNTRGGSRPVRGR